MCTCLCLSLSHVQFFGTPWAVASQAPLSMGFPRQEYWSGLPFPPPGDLHNPGIEPLSPAGGFFTTEPPTKYLRQNFYRSIGQSCHQLASGVSLYPTVYKGLLTCSRQEAEITTRLDSLIASQGSQSLVSLCPVPFEIFFIYSI